FHCSNCDRCCCHKNLLCFLVNVEVHLIPSAYSEISKMTSSSIGIPSGMDARVPAMGLSASAAMILVTLPPVPCASICSTAHWVMYRTLPGSWKRKRGDDDCLIAFHPKLLLLTGA